LPLAQSQTATNQASDERAIVERFVHALAARDQQAALGLYEPDAEWEVHVPGGDGLQRGVGQIGELLRPWFTGRDGFDIAEYQLVGQGTMVALRWELHWRDELEGAPCISHQSHFFDVRGGRIHRHWLYCSGVRVYQVADDHRHGDHSSA